MDSPKDDILAVRGGARLNGRIAISGAKNAALPLMAASIMAESPLTLTNVPDLTDTQLMLALLDQLGVASHYDGEKIAFTPIDTPTATPIDTPTGGPNTTAPYAIVQQIRASITVLGPLLARFGRAKVSMPGGDAIGIRPVDLHLMALQALGAEVTVSQGYIEANAANGLRGAEIAFPLISVGATENALMAATLARGGSIIKNAACEPEIIDLAECLIAMGAKIHGAGTDTIAIEGAESLHGCTKTVIPDRIEAGTFAIAAAMTGGRVTLEHCTPSHLSALWEVMEMAGVGLELGGDSVTITAPDRIQATDITTSPYPAFPTDLQAQLMAMMCCAEGGSTITETIFENRFMHVPELIRMGAKIEVAGNKAVVTGGARLYGTQVMATDIRASVSLVLAGLVAHGTTSISGVHHLDRGYARLEQKLTACGARLSREGG